MTQELVLTQGLPASGKTTWAMKYIKKNNMSVNLNRDDFRKMMFGPDYKFSRRRERLVSQAQESAARAALEEGNSVVISDTNFNENVVNKWKDIAGDMDVEFRIKFIHVELEEALRRNEKRCDGIPASVIKRMYRENIEEKHTFEHNTDLPPAIIVDIDGTLASMEDEEGNRIRGPYQWDRVDEDLPQHDIFVLVNTLKASGFSIVVMSGRDGSAYDKTKEWLDKYNLHYDELYLRNEGDMRKDAIIKWELFNLHVRDEYDVRFVLDDRDQMIDLWRSKGLRCLQVDYGDF